MSGISNEWLAAVWGTVGLIEGQSWISGLNWISSTTMVQVTEDYAAHFYNMYVNKHDGKHLTDDKVRILLLTLSFVLRSCYDRMVYPDLYGIPRFVQYSLKNYSIYQGIYHGIYDGVYHDISYGMYPMAYIMRCMRLLSCYVSS
jgi:hypothetical protein